MPIAGQWWTFAENIVQYEYDAPGVYELANAAQQVVYIGASDQVRRRLREHLAAPPNSCIRRNAALYRVEYTEHCWRRERELYDEHVRRFGRPPVCNDVRP
jgi:predicted GIY-YIG superfamily endonuclease